MTDDEKCLADQKAREQREADLFIPRIIELQLEPIQGKFDADHLKAVHAYIFQDLPEHQPGVTRGDTPDWTKTRVLEGRATGYDVRYASDGIEARIADALDGFGGPEAIKGLSPQEAAGRLASLYGDLDHAHPFYEGNSRTLREFTRELASEAGFTLDWTPTAVGTQQRNALYVARDLAVLERAYPDLTPEKAMQTKDRAEYEASFVIEGLKRAVGDRPLNAIISQGLSAEPGRESPAPSVEAELTAVTGGVFAGAMKLASAAFDAIGNAVESILAPAPTLEQKIEIAKAEQIADTANAAATKMTAEEERRAMVDKANRDAADHLAVMFPGETRDEIERREQDSKEKDDDRER